MKKINLGCGEDYQEGWINVDFRDNIKIDVKHNLEKIPYPFKKDSIDIILMKQVLEHLEHPLQIMKELIRICKNGARILIYVPHANSYAHISGIEHRGFFTEHTFSEHHLKEYELDKNLRLAKQQFIFVNKWKKLIPFKKYLKIFLNGIYDDLYFEFEVKK
ncbi:methyltransferase domain-containing protein [Candidatus Pacearchaeota archaeon]|jgi:predicted SAM-dependent methyltransferase|nr:methyltransferase domain-containing protein [Candidatus Pacearchaeota archaeon]